MKETKKNYEIPQSFCYEFELEENLMNPSNEVGFGDGDGEADTKHRSTVDFSNMDF